ncbi:ATP-grasp domain-containing protein [Parageobacillus thermoglucosidasius]|uniref:ATP-grasp domain-containing protein n=1 Tax=Parageobacillus thermoglucosidasius TaxID=1426 RepID=UPI00025B4ED0|nr:ATP-grasp domain-containing protein [Parageobacillus thermoglucosidasius]EID42450.1 carbamoyl-phosphate synthase L chain, ATP-binding domain [Parageobacillus thermoglucosidasius TNO-09.020]KYD12506.1 hypothetical protein B4168_3409 [Anoxybacillus flavithermus]OAO84596.1 ATP-grasp enzyme-like protein [Parageobacillus thermoglucosidasius]BDG30670.1 hypothetical protein PthBH41_03820 [Parageobacillus thermoglucosidasius]
MRKASLKFQKTKGLATPPLIFGTDIDAECIGRYFVDYFWQMTEIDCLSIQKFIEYCKEHDIFAVIPTRDGDLLYFSKYADLLADNGIRVMVSQEETVQCSIDKLKFSKKLLSLGFPSIPTFENIEDLKEIHYYVVKERFGAGSKGIGLRLTKQQALRHGLNLQNPIFQPYIDGKEFSIDLYVSLNRKVHGIITRTRDYVINGESHISTTQREKKLEDLCTRLALDMGFYGHIVIQVIKDKKGDYHIVECNSRFGGASTLSIEAGLDSFYWFFLESIGESLIKYPFNRSKEEKRLIRFVDDLIIDV